MVRRALLDWERWELDKLQRATNERDELWRHLVACGSFHVYTEARAEEIARQFDGVEWRVEPYGERVFMGVRDWRYRVFRLGSDAWACAIGTLEGKGP